MLESLGYDERYPYPNVQISDKYHIIQVQKRKKDIHHFRPNQESGCGIPGGNFMTRCDLADHEIVRKELTAPTLAKNIRFNSIDRYDRPVGMMGAAISEAH